MPILTPAELISTLPGAQEDIASGSIKEAELIASVRALGAQLPDSDQTAARAASELQIRMPGTRFTIGISSGSLALLRLGWSAYKYHMGHADFGDALNISTAVNQLISAVNSLNEESGESCAYLALGSVASFSDLLTGNYPSTAAVTGILHERGGDWCGLTCRFHSIDHAAFDTAEVQTVMEALASKGIVKRGGTEGWWITI